MRLLVVDIDTLRADHLGCHGYARPTSPTIDDLATQAVRFEQCYASDVPCLPSRSALITGRFGTRNGVVSHGGAAAQLRPADASRGFQSTWYDRSWATRLRRAGYHTATISSFAERHTAYQWHYGFDETVNPGKLGLETADEVGDLADDWLSRHGHRDRWVLHVHLWDPHTPYRTPPSYGEPFAGLAYDDWVTEPVRASQWELAGPHSAQETNGFEEDEWGVRDVFPRQPLTLPDLDAVRRAHDGYDTGIRYADDQIARLLDRLDGLGVLDETAVWITADHGENFGELGYWCDHQSADKATAHIPAILAWPGLEPQVVGGLHYHLDVAATVAELAGARPSRHWDGRSCARMLRDGTTVAGRDHLVVTQGAWTAQRGVRFDRWLYLHTRHDGFHLWPAELLFDLEADPYEQHDRATDQPDVVARARGLLAEFLDHNAGDGDPLDTVLAEGGPWHVRGHLPDYLDRLRVTGRAGRADRLAARSEPVGG